MPHFLAKTIELPKLPLEIDGYHFLFLAKDKNEILIPTIYLNKKFIIKIRDRGSDIYVGYDKSHRVSPIGVLKGALSILKRYSKDVISENLTITKERQKELSGFQKEPSFFLDYKFDKDILLEVGFGSGRHLIYQAQKNRDKIIVGIEIHKPSIEQVLRRIKLEGLENVFIVSYDARLFFELLPKFSVEAIFVHFPVPWDKKPHRRVISQNFIKESRRILKSDGVIELRTDSERYFRYSFEEFMKLEKSSIKFEKNRDLDVVSKYEDRWRKQDKNIYDIIFSNNNPIDRDRRSFDFEFRNVENIRNIINIEKTIKKEEYFVHVEKIYEIDGSAYLLSISFGSFETPERRFIVIDGSGCQYFGSKPIPTKANIGAHKEIEMALCT